MEHTKLLFTAFIACMSSALSAQSMLWENGSTFARKLGENLYEPVPPGVVSYKVENNQFRTLFDGIPISNKPAGYCKHLDDMYVYYDSDDNIVARYIPSEGRYYLCSAVKEDVTKEVSCGVLLDGVLYMGGEPSVRYYVEDGFDPVVVGFFLFIH